MFVEPAHEFELRTDLGPGRGPMASHPLECLVERHRQRDQHRHRSRASPANSGTAVHDQPIACHDAVDDVGQHDDEPLEVGRVQVGDREPQRSLGR